MNSDAVVKQIAETLSKAKSVLVTIHESPDGDAAGSMLAIYDTLTTLKKDVVMYSMDVVPMKHRFLKNWEKITSDTSRIDGKNFDVLLMLDCGDRNRSGDFITDFRGYSKLINIDHHISNNMFGDLNLVDAHASCTGEEVYRVIKELISLNSLSKINSDIATALLTALYDDTGGMRYVSTTSTTLNIAADLVDNGANCAFVSENLFFSVSRQKMELTSRVLSTLTFEKEGKIAYLVMTIKDRDESNAMAEDSEGLIDFPRAIFGVEVAFLIKEVGDKKFKVSFRSRGKVDVNKFCANFGGGGHKVAAGCTVNGSLQEVKNIIVTELQKLLV